MEENTKALNYKYSVLKTSDVYCPCWLEASAAKELGRDFGSRQCRQHTHREPLTAAPRLKPHHHCSKKAGSQAKP